jgi:predicted CxxxxCH...CXXCH cytochrome family protein
MRHARLGTVTVALLVALVGCDTARPIAETAAVSDCARCHGYPPPPFVAGGAAHPANNDCSLCHPQTVQADDVTLVPGGLHLNGTVEATGGHAAGYADPAVHGPDALDFLAGAAGAATCTDCHGADYDGGSSGKSCNDCHAAALPAPGFADWQANCTFCHGAQTPGWTVADLPLAAPPEGVLGATAPTDPRVGAHQRHLGGGSYSDPFTCATCHAVPADLAHVDGSVAVALVGAGQRALPASLGAYAPAGQTCAAYCHGSTIAVPAPAPQWTATGPLACNACHGLPPPSGPTFLAPNAHDYHVGLGATCGSCHAGYTGSSVSLATHVNGAKDVVVSGTTINGWDCGTCHDLVGLPPATHPVPYPTHTGDALAGIGSCTGCHGADYGGGLGGLAPSCNGCHVGVSPAPGFSDWKTNCTFCHGTRTPATTTAIALAAPPQAVVSGGDQTRANPKVGAHQAHLAQGVYANALPCSSCHAVPSGAEALTHFQGNGAQGAIAFGPTATKGVTGAAYSGGTCSVYCHGSGTELANPAGKVSPAWTSTGPACDACHGLPPSSGPTSLPPNAHEYHLGRGVTCGSCHAGYTGASANLATHVNGEKEAIVGATRVTGWDCATCHGLVGVPPASHPVPYPTHTGDALAGIGSCTGCHGADYGGGLDGLAPSCNLCHQVVGYADWKTNCTFCHGTRTPAFGGTPAWRPAPPQTVAGTGDQTTSAPRVGAHQKHAGNGSTLSNGVACAECHPPASDLGHLGGTGSAQLAWGPLATSGGAGASMTSGTCANYCHGATLPGTGRAAPTWAPPTALTCGSCHEADPTTNEHPSQNQRHSGFSCSICHGAGFEPGSSVDKTLHVDGAVNKDASLNWQSTPVKSCDPACHGRKDW